MMKNKLVILLVLSVGLSIAFSGCTTQDKVDGALIENNPESVEQNQKETARTSNFIEERAIAEGVSAKEMEQMIKELAALTVERYGDTYENYVAALEKEGKTPFDEFATAADNMGITIKEYYDYEIAKPERSEQDKEIMRGMNDVAKEVESIDLSGLEEQAKELEQNAAPMERTGDVKTNKDILEMMKYEVLEVTGEENESGLEFYGIEYTSKKEVAEVLAHFNSFLKGTENYFIMDGSPGGAVVSGTINGNGFDMSCERDFDNGITHIAIMYNGKIEK